MAVRYYTESELTKLIASKKAINGKDYVQVTGPELGTLYRGNRIGTLTFITNNFDLRAQNAVGSILENTSNNTLVYDEEAHTIESDMTDTGATAGTYGTSTMVAEITIDDKGRVLSATEIPIFLPPSSLEPTYAKSLMLGGM